MLVKVASHRQLQVLCELGKGVAENRNEQACVDRSSFVSPISHPGREARPVSVTSPWTLAFAYFLLGHP